MTDRKANSLRKAADIASMKAQENSGYCLRSANCLPQFKILHDSSVEKGEKVLKEKILRHI